MTQAEFARQIGVSAPRLNKLIKQGLIPSFPHDIEAARVEFAATRLADSEHKRDWAKKQKELAKEGKHFNQKANRKPKNKENETEPSDVLESLIPDDNITITRMYNKARAKEKTYAAMLRELEYKIQSGEFIHINDVREDAEKTTQAIRAGLSSLPSRLAPRMLHRENLAEIQTIIETCVDEMIRDFRKGKYGRVG